MTLYPAVTRSIDVLRAETGKLLGRARDETTEQVAQFSGRGADWVDEAGRVLADGAVALAVQLTDAAGASAVRVADRFAVAVDRWSTGLGDRMVRLGAELADSRRERA